MRVISQYITNELNAGPKAKRDIEEILKRDYGAETVLLKLNGKETDSFFRKVLYRLKKLYYSVRYINGEDLLVVQFPFNNYKLFLSRAKRKVAIIHDLEGIRQQNSVIENREIEALKLYDYVVAHNEKMRSYLVSKGIRNETILTIDVFDYLCKGARPETAHHLSDNPKIVYTGNLEKSPFIKALENSKMNFELLVYGVGNLTLENDKVTYMGKLDPDILPNKIKGDLGLVWDGELSENKNDLLKEYTRYNTPHKLSCYIAAGLPVIVWKESAVASFVKDNDIGYVINDLYEINSLSFDDYETKCNNVVNMAEEVRTGHFTKNAIEHVLATGQYNG